MVMRIEFEKYGDPDVLKWRSIDLPDLSPDQVKVKNHAIGVNYIDTYVRRGLYPVAQFPSGLGSEAAGEVIAVGKNVTRVKTGDRVVYCQSALGAYSEQHIVSQDKVVKLPDDISDETAAAVFLKGLTVYYLLHLTYPVQAGETILFHAAAGGVGNIACQWARALNVRLIGTVGSALKAQRAKEAGAWATINSHDTDMVQQLLKLTHGQKVPVVYDSVGKATWEDSLNCLQPRGLLVSYGNASGPVTGVDLGILNQKGSLFVTRPSLNGYITTPEQLDRASQALFGLLSSGEISVSIAEQQKFSLREAGKAHQALESRKTLGSSLLIP